MITSEALPALPNDKSTIKSAPLLEPSTTRQPPSAPGIIPAATADEKQSPPKDVHIPPQHIAGPLPPAPVPPPIKPREFVPTPNRNDRRVQFGVDCAELVHFTHWEPGGEHIKQLVVKNVVMKTQKIKYKLPQTRYFSMEFPETITLSAGMNWSIPITFRPVAKENYHDVIEFTTSFGKFYLPVKATLPEHVLDFPDTVDFELCPVRETAKKIFLLHNVGELASAFEWTIAKPFAISPRSGELTPGSSLTVTIEFKPEDATVIGATAVCAFGDRRHWEKSKVTQAMSVGGIGKFSFLKIEGGQKTFDFGDVFVGRSVEKKFALINSSAVHANFKIKPPERDVDPYFVFSTTTGTVQSESSMTISVTFTPVAAGLRSTDYYDIATVSGNIIRVTCTGRGIGPKVTLNSSVVNFNDVPADTTATRALFLQNHSSTTAFYQFLTDSESIFRFDKPWGSISPHSSVALTVKFTPYEAINYYRRVYCLVEHHDGLVLDILGTCYNEKRRPATFHPKYIENYLQRKKNGLWSYGPEQLEEMIKSGTVSCNQGILNWNDQIQAQAHISKNIVDSTYDECKVASEYFYENTGDCEAVTLVDTHVDFGSCSRYRVIDSQYIRIANNTKGKMSCVWIIPGDHSGEETVFSVTPAIADILPKSTADFKVNFRPTIDNSIYGMQLECFVYFKSMRNFRLVNEDTFTPPWCLTPMVTGNTFSLEQETFIPKIDFGATRLDFPSCHVDKSVYRTVRVSNTGDTPVNFAILDGGLTGIGGGTALAGAGGASFTVKPRVGLLHKNESRLLVFRFSPSEQRIYEQALKCSFNSSAANSYDLQMRGVGYYPHLSFAAQNTLCYKPTCIGAVAKSIFTARNTSRITVCFEWRIPAQYASVISIEPTTGIMPSNGTLELTCTFAPNIERQWVIKIPCFYHHELRGTYAIALNRRSTLTVIGQGTHGRITAQPKHLDLSAVLVHSLVEKEIVLANPTECDVFYNLELIRIMQSPEGGESAGSKIGPIANDEGPQEFEEVVQNNVSISGLEIAQRTNILPARSHQTLRVRVRLSEQVSYRYRVFYRLEPQTLQIPAGSSTLTAHSNEPLRRHLCDIVALGVHPLIQITDVRCEGFSKSLLWQLFSLQRLNEILSNVDPPPRDIVEENSFPVDSAIPGDDIIDYSGRSKSDPDIPACDFDFGATPVGCRPSVFHFNFRNSGVVQVEWVFYFPNDLEIKIEHWADPGDYTDEQLHHNLIIDNEIFTIHPKAGWLEPNESVHVTMTYSHEFAGLHKLPVLFKLKNGTTQSSKEISLHFVGYSIPTAKKCLHLHSSAHTFQPVHIGTREAPVQTYHLMNRGAVSLDYTVDLRGLQQLKDENQGVEIFSCRRSSGTIGPGQIEYIDWVFRPLENKDYEVSVPVTVVDGQSRMVTFRGKGIQEYDALLDSRSYVDRIPSVQHITMPRQMAQISKERINFGHVPLQATVREVAVVQNTHPTNDVSFNWIIPSTLHQILKITPMNGFLQSGESKVCKFTFQPRYESRVFETNIICEVIDETELAAYNEAMNVIETAKREGRPLSVVMDTAPALRRDSVRMSIATAAAAAAAGGAGPSGGMIGGSQHDLSKAKYRTLPPITPPGIAGSVPSNKQIEDESKRPQSALSATLTSVSVTSDMGSFTGLGPSPEPFHLFVCIVARSCPPEECRRQYANYDLFFYQKRLNHDLPEMTTKVMSALSSLIDDIFQEPDVQSLPDLLRTENTPYYAQIAAGRSVNGIVAVSAPQASMDTSTNEGHAGVVGNCISAPDLQNMVESILEGTIYNLMQEANLDEFDFTKHQMVIIG
ncbi:hypothetical protein DFS34DRAFT_577433 [Phlyctochytrium arcticum]|nr:hypothetical protein DFS34DRAFT_577433 [Phlyctochytrium arcticum]